MKNYGSSRRPYMGYNEYPDTGLTISPAPSKIWASNPLLTTLACTCPPSPLEGPTIYTGLYVENFIQFSKSDAVEEQFRTSLSYKLQVDWQIDSDWFIGTYFEWSTNNQCNLSFHLFQLEFVKHTPE